ALATLGNDRVEARKLAKDVLAKKPGHPKASLVLARLEHLAGNVEEERKLLEAALNKDDPDPQVLQALGKIYYDLNEFPKAAEVFELGRKAEPLATEWLLQLARGYAQTGAEEKQIAVRKGLVPTDAD